MNINDYFNELDEYLKSTSKLNNKILLELQNKELRKRKRKEKVKIFFYNLGLAFIITLFASIAIGIIIVLPWVQYVKYNIHLCIPILSSSALFIVLFGCIYASFIEDDLKKDKK